MKLSLIVPCYNEAGNVALLKDAVMRVFQGAYYDYEMIFVDDGSTDETFANLKALYRQHDCPIKVVRFSRNFGKEASIYAGLQHADGDYICIIDADLQQRPEVVRDMVQILENNPEIDAVAAYQKDRSESKVLSFFKKAFYKIISQLSDTQLMPGASDFRTFRRCVADSILELREYHRFSKGIFAWVGYNTAFIPYEAAQRATGKSKWNFRKLCNYAIDGIIGFSTKPLRIASLIGSVSAIASFVYLIIVILQKLIWGINIPGYATIIVLILFLGGMQLCCIGIIGEYVGRTFEQSKHRPVYLVKDYLGEK